MAAIDAPAGVPHYGLRSMRERAAAIGAELESRTARGRPLVTLDMPLAGHERMPSDGAPIGRPAAAPAAVVSRVAEG